MSTFTAAEDRRHACDADCEHYYLLARGWCTTYARRLIHDDPTAATRSTADISGMDDLVGITEPKPGTTCIGVRTINPDRAARTNLDEPLLIVHVHDDHGTTISTLPIDGWHRIYRARQLGYTHLPAYLLNGRTERACRLND